MVDFSKYLKNTIEDKIDDRPRKTIRAVFTTISGDWDAAKNEYVNRVEEDEVSTVDMVIDNGANGKIVKFLGGPTGHESYYIDSLIRCVDGRIKDDKLYICAGTINSWKACHVSWTEAEEFISEFT